MSLLNKNNTFKIMVINDFYKYPDKVRNYALKLEYNTNGNYSGYRSNLSSEDTNIKEKFEKYLEPICGKIIDFEKTNEGNGCFEYSVEDSNITKNNKQWTGILFLSPLANVESGIKFYNVSNEEVDYVGNTFNRIVFFDSGYKHKLINNFGKDLNTASLYQTFYFSTEK